jgi:cytochrome d ubiquinol oxidase subunit II
VADLLPAFPESFAAVMSTLIIPLLLALLGIVLRGASFASRKYAATLAQARLFGAIFAASSLITPSFLGCVAGAIASGRVPAYGRGPLIDSWVNPTSIFGGPIAVGTCTFLAGVFLVADAARRRSRAHGTVANAVPRRGGHDRADRVRGSAADQARRADSLCRSDRAGSTPHRYLSRRRCRHVGAAGPARFPAARLTAVLAVASLVFGWGVAQYPWLLVDQVTIADAAGSPATLAALLVVALAGVIVVPAMAYLYSLTQSEPWTKSKS